MRTARSLGIVSAVLVLTGLVFLSPLAFLGLANLTEADWLTLGNIGQAYGGISALFSGLALSGVVGSFALQSRQLKLQRRDALRTYQANMLRFAIEDPETYAPLLGWTWTDDPTDIRRSLFLTLLMNNNRTGFVTGEFTEENIRSEFAQELFRSDFGREWWARALPIMQTAEPRGIGRRFVLILEEEYQKSVSLGSPEIKIRNQILEAELAEVRRGYPKLLANNASRNIFLAILALLLLIFRQLFDRRKSSESSRIRLRGYL